MTPHDDNLQIVPDPDKLDRYHRQQLSAMLDGELSPDQARFMLRRLQHDAGLAGCWERWQVCGDVLRGQRNALLPADFAQRVSSAIAAGDRQAADAAAHRGGTGLLRWGGGVALAASVAMVALLVGRHAGPAPEQAPAESFAQSAPASEPVAAQPAEGPAVAASPGDGTPVLADAGMAPAEPSRPDGRQERQDAGGTVAQHDRAVAVASDVPRLAVTDAPAPARSRTTVAGVTGSAAAAGPEQAREALFAGLQHPREGIGADPFRSLPMTAASRPWPRASQAAADGYAVGLGNAMPATSGWPGQAFARGPVAAERFGLPADPPQLAPGLLPAATAIGSRAVGPDESAAAPANRFAGPR